MAKPQYALAPKGKKKTGIPAMVGPLSGPVATPAGFGDYATARAAAAAAVAHPAANPFVGGTNPYAGYYDRVLSALQTPGQIEAQARRTALNNERATLAAQQAASERIIGQYQDQSSRAQGFARALATLQGGQDEQAFARYSDAASRLGGLGAGLSGAVADAYQGQVDQTSETINRLTGGAGQVTGVPSGDAIRNASNYMGVTVPAGSLQEDAVSAARLAQSDAAKRAQNIALIAKGYDVRANEAIAQEAADARTTIAGRGAAIQSAIDSLTNNRSNVLNTLGSVVGAQAGWKQQQATSAANWKQQQIENAAALRKEASDAEQRMISNALAQHQQATADRYLNNTLTQTAAGLTGVIPGTNVPTYAASQDATQNAQSNQRLANEAERINHVKYNPTTLQPMTDAKGNLIPSTGYKLAPGGQSVVALAKPGKSKAVAGGGGLTAASWSSLVKSVGGDIREGLSQARPAGKLYKPKDTNADDEGFIPDPNKPGVPAIPYADALSNAIAGGPNTPRWKTKATQLVNAAYAPGRNGRPWTAPTAKAAAMSTAKKAYADGMHEQDLVAAMTNAGLPSSAIRNAVRIVYYMPNRSPIRGIPPTAEDYPYQGEG